MKRLNRVFKKLLEDMAVPNDAYNNSSALEKMSFMYSEYEKTKEPFKRNILLQVETNTDLGVNKIDKENSSVSYVVTKLNGHIAELEPEHKLLDTDLKDGKQKDVADRRVISKVDLTKGKLSHIYGNKWLFSQLVDNKDNLKKLTESKELVADEIKDIMEQEKDEDKKKVLAKVMDAVLSVSDEEFNCDLLADIIKAQDEAKILGDADKIVAEICEYLNIK